MSIEQEVRSISEEEALAAVAKHVSAYHTGTFPPPDAPPDTPPPPDVPRNLPDQLPVKWQAEGIALTPSPGGWDHRFLGAMTPCAVVKQGGRWLLYYIGAEGDRTTDQGPARRALGVATSEDGYTWKKHPRPILTHIPHDNQEEGVYGCAPVVLDDVVYLYYTAITAVGGSSTSESVNTDIFLATSTDGINFVNVGMVVNHKNTDVWGSGDELFASHAFYSERDLWSLYYLARNSRIERQLGIVSGRTPEKLTARSGPVLSAKRIWSTSIQEMDQGDRIIFADMIDPQELVAYAVKPGFPADLGIPLTSWKIPGLEHSCVYWHPGLQKWVLLVMVKDDDRIYRYVSAKDGSPPPSDPPVDPPSQPPSSTKAHLHPQFPYMMGHKDVTFEGGVYNCRFRDRPANKDQPHAYCRVATLLLQGKLQVSVDNSTCTYFGKPWNKDKSFERQDLWYDEGEIEFDALYHKILDEIGGGNHYHQVTSFNRDAMRGGPWETWIKNVNQLRMEIANLGSSRDGGRVLLHNYNGRGSQEKSLDVDGPLKMGQKYHWKIRWENDARQGTSRWIMHLDSKKIFDHEFEVEENALGAAVFFPCGHVGGRKKVDGAWMFQEGHVEVSDVVIKV